MDCDATWKFINGSHIVSGVIVAIVSVLMTVLVLRIYSKRNKRAELEAQDEYDSDKRTLKANARNEVIRETHEARLRSDIEPRQRLTVWRHRTCDCPGSRPKSRYPSRKR